MNWIKTFIYCQINILDTNNSHRMLMIAVYNLWIHNLLLIQTAIIKIFHKNVLFEADLFSKHTGLQHIIHMNVYVYTYCKYIILNPGGVSTGPRKTVLWDASGAGLQCSFPPLGDSEASFSCLTCSNKQQHKKLAAKVCRPVWKSF